jgi:hypothetical protein
MSPLQSTNAEIRRRMQQEAQRREERRVAELPMRAVDRLLAELEQLHLDGRKRVPETFEARLVALNAALPAGLRAELRSRITIVHLMDKLYAIQDRLLSDRASRHDLVIEDEDSSLPRAS